MDQTNYTLITGASSGIGEALARAYAARGSNVIIAARRADRLQSLLDGLNAAHPSIDVVVRDVDLSSNQATIEFYESLRDFHIVTWINNAGRGNHGEINNPRLDSDLQMLHTNVDAVAILSSLYVRDYQDVDGATLVNISSIGGYLVVPGATLYCASKFFVSALTEGINHEMISGGHALRAKVMAPTTTATGFEQNANELADEVDYAAMDRPYHTAEEMAAFILALAESDEVVGEIDFATRGLKLGPAKHPHL